MNPARRGGRVINRRIDVSARGTKRPDNSTV